MTGISENGPAYRRLLPILCIAEKPRVARRPTAAAEGIERGGCALRNPFPHQICKKDAPHQISSRFRTSPAAL